MNLNYYDYYSLLKFSGTDTRLLVTNIVVFCSLLADPNTEIYSNQQVGSTVVVRTRDNNIRQVNCYANTHCFRTVCIYLIEPCSLTRWHN